MADDPIYLDNDYTIEIALTRANTTTRATEAATSLTGVTGWISATYGGTAVGAATTALTEATSLAGTYFGTIDRAVVNAALADYAGRRVWEVVDDTTNLRICRPLVVTRRVV